MPYVKKTRQQALTKSLSNITFEGKGDLTAAICLLQMRFCEQHFLDESFGKQRVNYQILSDAVSACYDAAHAFQIRIVDKYEVHKIQENGDIFFDFIRKANI